MMPKKPKSNTGQKQSQRAILRHKLITEGKDPDQHIKNAGRKGLYNEDILPLFEELLSKGLNNQDCAKALGIGLRTFYEWIDRHPQFAQSLKKYRGLADIEVENALFKSAIGFSYQEQKMERKFNRSTGQYEFVLTEEITKTVPPNTGAAVFYLKNRMPHRYKDKVETEISLGQGIEQLAFAIKRRED